MNRVKLMSVLEYISNTQSTLISLYINMNDSRNAASLLNMDYIFTDNETIISKFKSNVFNYSRETLDILRETDSKIIIDKLSSITSEVKETSNRVNEFLCAQIDQYQKDIVLFSTMVDRYPNKFIDESIDEAIPYTRLSELFGGLEYISTKLINNLDISKFIKENKITVDCKFQDLLEEIDPKLIDIFGIVGIKIEDTLGIIPEESSFSNKSIRELEYTDNNIDIIFQKCKNTIENLMLINEKCRVIKEIKIVENQETLVFIEKYFSLYLQLVSVVLVHATYFFNLIGRMINIYSH